MPKLTYFPLIIDRWIAGTRHMTFEQKGFYLELLVWLYEKPDRYLVDEAHISRILGCRPQITRRIWPVISEKFRRFSGGFTHSLVKDLQRNGMQLRGLQRSVSPTDPDPDPEKKDLPTEDVKKSKTTRNTKVFKKPSVNDVAEYCTERRNTVAAVQFVDYYESNGWKVGRSGMRDWKAAVRTWERNGNGRKNGRDYEPKADAIRRQQRERYEGRVDEGADAWLLGIDDSGVRD